jgi:hypothetical protein
MFSDWRGRIRDSLVDKHPRRIGRHAQDLSTGNAQDWIALTARGHSRGKSEDEYSENIL